MWPVDAVVGENGAFYFRYDHGARRMICRFADDEAMREQYPAQLNLIAKDILAAVPGCAVAADQQYRETDLAIDFCEDVPPLPRDAVEKIAALMRARGMTAKISSIHVNGWFGDYNKLEMTRTLMREAFNIDLDARRGDYVFIGDSPNDEPTFEFFVHAVGVANVADFGALITRFPAYTTRALRRGLR
jgi:hydroxymethylpyrimidine pyrophosphatase-like HAD family hydrolase